MVKEFSKVLAREFGLRGTRVYVVTRVSSRNPGLNSLRCVLDVKADAEAKLLFVEVPGDVPEGLWERMAERFPGVVFFPYSVVHGKESGRRGSKEFFFRVNQGMFLILWERLRL